MSTKPERFQKLKDVAEALCVFVLFLGGMFCSLFVSFGLALKSAFRPLTSKALTSKALKKKGGPDAR